MSDEIIPSLDGIGEHISHMWQRIARTLENLACQRATEAQSAADAEGAADIAKVAEGCFWQSTGEGTSFDLSRKVET